MKIRFLLILFFSLLLLAVYGQGKNGFLFPSVYDPRTHYNFTLQILLSMTAATLMTLLPETPAMIQLAVMLTSVIQLKHLHRLI